MNILEGVLIEIYFSNDLTASIILLFIMHPYILKLEVKHGDRNAHPLLYFIDKHGVL